MKELLQTITVIYLMTIIEFFQPIVEPIKQINENRNDTGLSSALVPILGTNINP